MFRCRIAVLCIGFLLSVVPTTHAKFTPGHFYTPIDDGFVLEWDENLEQVGQFQIPGVIGATGATFNDAGNLVLIARRNNAVQFLEVLSDGSIVREFHASNGPLLRGSYTDFDPVRGLYAFANDDRITVIDRDFNLVDSTPPIFSRASGVVFRDDGSLLAVDQFSSFLSVFDQDFALLDQIGVGGLGNVGMDVTADGDVLITSFADGNVFQYDFQTETVTPFITGFGFGDITDVFVLPTSELIVMGGAGPIFLYNSDGMLFNQSEKFLEFGDSVAYFIPSPNAAIPLATIMLMSAGRRRQG